MNILITGASGFLGRNLCERFETFYPEYVLYKTTSKTSNEVLESYIEKCDAIYHFAAVHRPKNEMDFEKINVDYLRFILQCLRNKNKHIPVILTSSIQAGNGTAYGISKVAAENLVSDYGKETKSNTHIIRLTNTFGKYARPHSHSVVATFCYNISHNMEIVVNTYDAPLNLYYIDDVIDKLVSFLSDNHSTFEKKPNLREYHTTVGKLAEDIRACSINDVGSSEQSSEYYSRLKCTYDWYANQE